jgi:hypothetical protein|tara:strand:- start:188 stop:466 length:279 start_codon:yes stop_codon:yes gene_type:complete
MCISFGGGAPTPISTPAPIQPQQPDLVQASQLPEKKELLDPDDIAGVEYGTSQKKEDERGAAQRIGTDALRIDVNTGGTGNAGGTGGLNVQG